MFRALINDAKSAATSAASALVVKYLARASVAVPFIIAVGFAIAAITHLVVNRFGAVAGCWLLAAAFTLIGLAATLFVKRKEQEGADAEQAAAASDTAAVAHEVAAQAPLALLGALMSTPLGPKALTGGVKTMARNLPLVVLLALIAMLFWPTEETAVGEAADDGLQPSPPAPEPNGAYRPHGNGYHRDHAA